jgi:hypothetical protein
MSVFERTLDTALDKVMLSLASFATEAEVLTYIKALPEARAAALARWRTWDGTHLQASAITYEVEEHYLRILVTLRRMLCMSGPYQEKEAEGYFRRRLRENRDSIREDVKRSGGTRYDEIEYNSLESERFLSGEVQKLVLGITTPLSYVNYSDWLKQWHGAAR